MTLSASFDGDNLFLIRFDDLNRLKVGVNFIKNLFIVIGVSHVQNFLVKIQRRVSHNRLSSVENFRLDIELCNEQRQCARILYGGMGD